MGWQEARQRYRDGSVLTDQKVEDLVARRALNGMGLVARQIPSAEQQLFGEVDPDSALWPRTYRILRALASQGRSSRVFGLDRDDPGYYSIEVLEVSPNHAEIIDLVPQLKDCLAKPFPVFLTRVKGTQVSRAYCLLDPDQARQTIWARPPMNLIAEAGPWWVAQLDTETFIKRLGPYGSIEDGP